MTILLSVVFIGLLGGMAVGLQSPMASILSQRLGTLQSVFVVHLGGAIAVLLPMLFWGDGSFTEWRGVPWYVWGAGALGIMVIAGVSFAIPRVGAAASTMLIVAGQLVIGAVLDHYGWLGVERRPFRPEKLLGFLVIAAGLWLVLRPR